MYLEGNQRQTWYVVQSFDIFFNEVLLQNYTRDQDCLCFSGVWASMSPEEEVAVRWYSGSFVAMKLMMTCFLKKNSSYARHFGYMFISYGWLSHGC